MNPIDKMTVRAIRRQEKTGCRAVDYLIRELKGMGFLQLARLYVRSDRSIRQYIKAEIWRRLFPFCR